jgi:hypothetical protein
MWPIMSLAVVLDNPPMSLLRISRYIGSNAVIVYFLNACSTVVQVLNMLTASYQR